MSYSNYLQALENRTKWLWWAQNKAPDFYKGTDTMSALPMYEHALKCGETFFMTKHFCDLVDTARREIPDNLKFDPTWMIADNGFLWLETPFVGPQLADQSWLLDNQKTGLSISAIAWFKLPPGVTSRGLVGHPDRISDDNTYQFLVYHDLSLTSAGRKGFWGFGCWSYFSLQAKDEVLDRVHTFEQVASQDWPGGEGMPTQAAYQQNRETDVLHEVRWIYTALHLMSQKLASTKQYESNRNVRRRMERDKVPFTTFYRIVTLRRLQEEQDKHPEKNRTVDWQWQWRVHGHGRWQWYPTLQDHKYIWVEDYIKGPENKPLKPAAHTIYIAKR